MKKALFTLTFLMLIFSFSETRAQNSEEVTYKQAERYLLM
jgi:hypothetical protein